MSRKAGHTKAAASDGEQVMTQVWHGLVDTLRRLPTVGERTDSDEQTMDDALGQLDLLISLKKNQFSGTGTGGGDRLSNHPASTLPHTSSINHANAGTSTIPNPTITVATPSTPSSSTGNGVTGKRRKRPSISLSPAPTPTHLDSPLRTASNTMGLGGPTKKERSATPSSMRERERDRARHGHGHGALPFGDQLPLQPGRRIAYKVDPNAGPAAGEGEAEEEGWILATIKRCLGDKLSYEVLDWDDANKSYTTTLDSIIPLPDPSTPSHLSSHPSQLENFPRHSIVLALYPDTTAFYQATVIASPVPGTGMGPQGGAGSRGMGKADPGAKRGKYVLAFVDDGDNTHEVDAKDVVKFPG